MRSRTRHASRAATLFVVLAGVCPVAALSLNPLLETSAAASVSIAATWDGLLHESTAAALVTAMESQAVWENGRIYTYTHVHVDRPVAGALGTGSDPWIRTMGGVVGKVGQLVEGEASFAPGEGSLLFLRPGPAGAFVVTARAQGQFPIVNDGASPAHLVKSNLAGMLIGPRPTSTAVTAAPTAVAVPAAPTAVAAPRLAAEAIHGRLVDDVAREVAAAWDSAHAR
jgi:hypothetical protein